MSEAPWNKFCAISTTLLYAARTEALRILSCMNVTMATDNFASGNPEVCMVLHKENKASPYFR